MREPGVGRSNLHMDQLTFYSSDSHPRLHIRTTPCLSSFKKTQTQTRNQTNYIRISKDGAVGDSLGHLRRHAPDNPGQKLLPSYHARLTAPFLVDRARVRSEEKSRFSELKMAGTTG